MAGRSISPASSLTPDRGHASAMAPRRGLDRFKPIDPWLVMRRHAWLVVAMVMLGILAGGMTWYAMRRYSPRYASEAQLEVTPRNLHAWAGLNSDIGRLSLDLVAASKRNEVASLMSEQTLAEALNQPRAHDTRWISAFTVQRDGESVVDTQAAVSALKNGVLSTSIEANSNLLPVRATTAHPGDAPQLLQAVLDAYLRRVRTEREGQSRGLRELYRTEVQDAQQRIDRLREQLAAFEQEANVDRLATMLEETSATFQTRTAQRNELESALFEARQRLKNLQAAQQDGASIEPNAAMVQEIESREAIRELDRDLRRLQRDRRTLLANFGPEHYRVRRIDDRIEATASQRQAEFEQLAREWQASQLNRTAETISQLENRLARIESELSQLEQRRIDLHQQLGMRQSERATLQAQLEQARRSRERAQDSLETVNVQSRHPDRVTVELKTAPTSPKLVSPKPEVVVPSVAMLVIGLGVGGLLLRETIDQRLTSPADIALIPEAETLGVLPEAEDDPSGACRIEGAVRRDPACLIAEAFRQVRTSVLSKMERRGHKTLLITGTQPDSGASSVAQNLACSFASHGRRVLLIDANLRRPAQARLNDVAASPGLIELLQREVNADQAIVSLPDMPLSIMPAGDHHHAAPELLAGPVLRDLLNDLETRFEIIVIDAPPALLTTDTQLLACQADAVVGVVRAGRDKRGMVQRMLRLLQDQRADVIGLVLNGARANAGGYYRQSYREFYRYNANGRTTPTGHIAPPPATRTVTPQAQHAEHEQ